MKKNKLFAIIGPSGVGKGTVIAEIKKKYSNIGFPISYTTRKMRSKEKNGVVYYFISENEFETMIKNGEFLEYQKVHNSAYYGSSKKEIIEGLKTKNLIREFDIQGVKEIEKIICKDQLVKIFITVDNWETLKKRIIKRNKTTKNELDMRYQSYLKEIEYKNSCDHVLISEENKVPELIENFKNILDKYT